MLECSSRLLLEQAHLHVRGGSGRGGKIGMPLGPDQLMSRVCRIISRSRRAATKHRLATGCIVLKIRCTVMPSSPEQMPMSEGCVLQRCKRASFNAAAPNLGHSSCALTAAKISQPGRCQEGLPRSRSGRVGTAGRQEGSHSCSGASGRWAPALGS